MAEELFRYAKEENVLNTVITTTVTLRDDGLVRVTQVSQRTVPGGGVLTELETNIDFTTAQWAQLTDAGFTPPAKRIIAIDDFVARITVPEMAAFQALMDNNATARAWWAKLMTRQNKGVDLDSPDLVTGLAFVKVKALDSATPADQRVWADAATADARIAALRA